MPWFRVDDGFWSHPKVVELSPDAIALWVRAGSYAAQHLTDGVISVSALPMLGGTRPHADELVIAGLWEQTDARTWTFKDWMDYQPSRSQILADRDAAAERKRRSREAARRKSQMESRRDAARDGHGTDVFTQPASSTPVIASPFCAKHQPNGPKAGVRCRDCGTARMAFTAAQAADRSKPAAQPFTVTPGALCPDGKHRLLADGTCTLCEYRGEAAS
jgi:hypothetical protein